MMKTLLSKRCSTTAATGAAGLILALGCSCGGKGGTNVDAEVAIVPEANIVISVDARGMQEAPIYRTLEALGNEEETAAAVPIEKLMKMQSLAQEKLGLTEDDVTRVLFSADLSNVDFDAPASLHPSSINMAVAVALAKPVALADLRSYLETQAKEDGEDVTFEEAEHKGTTLLYVEQGTPDAAPVRLGIAVQNKGRLVLAGTPDGLTGALDRADAKGSGAKNDAIARTRHQMPADAQFYLAFVPTERMMTKLREQAARRTEMAENSQGGNPMMAQSLQSATGMKSAGLSIMMDETLDLMALLAMASSEDAAQLKTVADTMLVGYLKMGMMQLSGGKGMPMADTLELVQDNSELTMKVSISEEDLNTAFGGLKQMFMQRMQPRSMPPPPPPSAPEAP